MALRVRNVFSKEDGRKDQFNHHHSKHIPCRSSTVFGGQTAAAFGRVVIFRLASVRIVSVVANGRRFLGGDAIIGRSPPGKAKPSGGRRAFHVVFLKQILEQ
jgi:hypothetical protein